MGVTIHFSGKLNGTELAGAINSELEDIANEMNWKYKIIDEDLKHFKGIIIFPHPKSELLSFIFDREGYTNDFRILELYKNDEDRINDNYVSIKTQFAPIEIHVVVIKILKYLKKKYIDNLDVYDEGRYWETGDKEILAEKISFLNKKMDEMEVILSEIKADEHETAESLIVKIENILKIKYGKN